MNSNFDNSNTNTNGNRNTPLLGSFSSINSNGNSNSSYNSLDKNDTNFVQTDEMEDFEETPKSTPNSYQTTVSYNQVLNASMQKIYDTITEPSYVKTNTERQKKIYKTFEKAFSLDKIGTGLIISMNFPKDFKKKDVYELYSIRAYREAVPAAYFILATFTVLIVQNGMNK